MTRETFKKLLQSAIDWMIQDAKENPGKYNNCGGESFEPFVKDALQYALNNLGVTAEIEYTPGSHVFPDIVLEFPDAVKYGVEVKSTKSNQWKINGNSVLGSTSENGIVETYIFFGKLVKNVPEFCVRKYEECVSDVAVTHSPRYKIDMELPIGETFFDKSGIPYSTIKSSDNPIALIQEYYREQGATAWWIAETSPPAIRLLNELRKSDRDFYISYGFAYFPEILSTANDKYHNFALWLLTKHSIIATNIRDYFSASGKKTIIINNCIFKDAPKVYTFLRILKDSVINAIDTTSPDTLREIWEYDSSIADTLNAKISIWLSLVKKNTLQNNKEKTLDSIGLINEIFREFL